MPVSLARIMSAVLALVLAFSLIATLPVAAQQGDVDITVPDRDDLTEVEVTRVVDGDTVEVDVDGQELTLRLIGIDTPEVVDPRQPVACFGREASDLSKDVLEVGTTVFLERDISDTDRYQRSLRYIWMDYDGGDDRFDGLETLDGTDDGDLISFNLLLVAEGYAASSPYAPDIKHQDAFDDAETAAREDERGLWGDCGAFGVAADLPESPVADCAPFTDFEQAQQYYLANPDEQPVIDPNEDGFACEVYFGVDTTGLVPPDGPGSTTTGGSSDGGSTGVIPGGGVAEPTTAPAVPTVPTAPPVAAGNCDPSYPGVCIPPYSQVGDLNCGDISARRFQVIPPDPHGFDGDSDGVGCES